MHKSEISSLKWENYDGDSIRLRAENAKNGNARLIPIEGELVQLMERRKAARQFKTKNTRDAFRFHLSQAGFAHPRILERLGNGLPDGGRSSAISRSAQKRR
jgi:integrase